MGRTLGRALAGLGHTICLGTRNPAALAEWRETAGADASVDGVRQTVAWANLIFLATPGRVVEEVVKGAGTENFSGKVVVDATDPLDFSSGRPGLFVGTTDSLGERIQRLLPKAHVVKAFNTVAAAVMVEPSLTGGEPDLMIAGNHQEAKEQVVQLARGFGWKNIIDFGGIENARWLEALSLLWVVLQPPDRPLAARLPADRQVAFAQGRKLVRLRYSRLPAPLTCIPPFSRLVFWSGTSCDSNPALLRQPR